MSDIDTPQLDDMQITFFNQIDFDTPRLAQFINRTPKLGKRDATVQFNDDFVHVELSPETLMITISCRKPDRQLSSIEQVCNSSLRPLSTVEVLKIKHQYSELVWKNDAIENILWLQLLLPFTAVKNLYLYKEFAPCIAAALRDLVGDRIMEVLPSLQNIFVEGLEPLGPFQEKIGRFVAARQLFNHPIAVSKWDKNSGWDEESDGDDWKEDFDRSDLEEDSDGDDWEEDSDGSDLEEDSDGDDWEEDPDGSDWDEDSDM